MYDKPLLVIVGLLLAFGVLIFISASTIDLVQGKANLMKLLVRQVGIGVIGGVVAGGLMSLVNINVYKKLALPVYVLTLIGLLLVFVDGIGYGRGSVFRWIDLGFISMQPVELFKVGFVFLLALIIGKITTTKKHENVFLYHVLLLVSILAPLFILTRHPDYGSILVLITTGVLMYLLLTSNWKPVILGGVLLILYVGFSILAFQNSYVVVRLTEFFNGVDEVSLLKNDYQPQQSRIAIGSGGLLGKGYLNGSYKINRVPEVKTDYVFAVIGEEFGFIGTSITVLLFLAFALRSLQLAYRLRDNFARGVIIGLSSLIFVQSVLNIMVAIRLFPTTGMPLVFFSQGGTAIFVSVASIGIIMSAIKSGR